MGDAYCLCPSVACLLFVKVKAPVRDALAWCLWGWVALAWFGLAQPHLISPSLWACGPASISVSLRSMVLFQVGRIESLSWQARCACRRAALAAPMSQTSTRTCVLARLFVDIIYSC